MPESGNPFAPRRANRLQHASSPYLLQHQFNPVDWFEWSEDAFARAKREDKPVFLSIGYATCHWCHVMEHESFEDDAVAQLLNDHFIAIKVDREERPDLDHVYMAVCQMLSHHCGWPLTLLLTPDKRPFFVGTYIPRSSRGGSPGMLELLPAVADFWRSRREEIVSDATRISEALQGRLVSADDAVGLAHMDAAYRLLLESYDAEHGGFGKRPKFPSPHNLLFLLRYARSFNTPQAAEMAHATLHAMRRGGIFDQVGSGFHRYSTDERWFLPHFEKMLYDQAMLTLAYSEAYADGADPAFARTAREIITYVLRDMADPAGGFHSAEDADSEGEEGKFYVWSEADVRQVLAPDEADLWMRAFGFTREGTYREEATGLPTGTNIPWMALTVAELAEETATDAEVVQLQLDGLRAKLFSARQKRVRPTRDDKVLTDWNGLMIAALARAGRVLDEPKFIDAADRAADFLLTNMRRADGGLLHRYRAGEAGIEAFADDYAFTIWGLLELYRARFRASHLEAARQLADHLLDRFWDDKDGGLFFASSAGEDLIFRNKEAHDGAIPSANSVAADVLSQLAHLTGEMALEEKAIAIGGAFSGLARHAPGACTHLLAALMPRESGMIDLVIAGEPAAADTKALLAVLDEKRWPGLSVLLKPSGKDGEVVERLAPFTRNIGVGPTTATAYLCRNQVCGLPITSAAELRAQLNRDIEAH